MVLGWMLAWDFIGYPMGMRLQGLGPRLKWVFRNFGAFTLFGLTWAYFTHLRHFSVGIEADATFGVTNKGLGVMLQPIVRYSF